jgi:acetyl esterase/lipase
MFVLGIALAIPACRLSDVPLWGPLESAASRVYEVESVRDVPYYTGPGADDYRHQLDLYLPRGVRRFPVVVLVHGGAWVVGDKRCCGLYSSVGQFLASQGIGVVMPNYRLSPDVRHPEHVRDVARAVAWTRRYAAELGGDPDQLFLVGHSAGGHLVALLATDDTWLDEEGLTRSALRGVVAVSGVYHIPEGPLQVALGGTSARSFRLDELFPIRGTSEGILAPGAWLGGIPLRVNVFGPAFGDHPHGRLVASPLFHVQRGLPPFLILYAERDLPTLSNMAEDFHQALVSQGNEAHLVRVAGRNHNSVMFRAVTPDDPVARAIVGFIREHGPRGTVGGGPGGR